MYFDGNVVLVSLMREINCGLWHRRGNGPYYVGCPRTFVALRMDGINTAEALVLLDTTENLKERWGEGAVFSRLNTR